MGQTANASHASLVGPRTWLTPCAYSSTKEKPVLDIQAYYTEIDDGGSSVAEILNYSASPAQAYGLPSQAGCADSDVCLPEDSSTIYTQ